jgi:hypothetical protein
MRLSPLLLKASVVSSVARSPSAGFPVSSR